jgi:predicted transcriptional regulator of viral defense system
MLYRDPKAALRALTEIAASQGGYFTARQAESAGYGPTHLAYHRSAGNIERVGHGLYRMPAMPPADHDDLVRLWLWSRDRHDQPQAVFSHQTALAMHDLAEFIPRTIHLTVPPSFRKRPPVGCVLHKSRLDATRTRPIGPVPVTTPLQTLADLSGDASLPAEQFDRAVTEASSRGLIGAADAKRLRERVASRNRGGAST